MWSGRAGGAERALYQLVREQMKDDSQLPGVLYAQAGGQYWEESRALGCPVSSPGARNGTDILSLRRTAKLMRGWDIHHFHSTEPLLMLASLTVPGVRRVFTRRGGEVEPDLRKRVRQRATGVILRRGFHAYSGNTAHGARLGAEIFGLNVEDVAVTYNGLHFELLEPKRTAKEVRRELKLEDGDLVIGTAANLKAWKRIDLLIEGFARIDEPRKRLLILGDGEERERLGALVGRLGLDDRVIFAGLQPHVGDYLQVMDAFCLPSSAGESFGNAAVEAMGMGVPTVVFSDGGGMVEHIEDGKSGFVVGEIGAMVDRLTLLLSDRELRSAIGGAGRERVRVRYTPERSASAYRDLYEVALSGTAARRDGTDA